MPTAGPVVLSTIDGIVPTERLALVLMPLAEGGTRLELRQQSWSETVGWYTQSSVAIDSEQVADLRNSLGLGGAAGRLRRTSVSTTASGPDRPLRIVG
jgi:hypothetical protein